MKNNYEILHIISINILLLFIQIQIIKSNYFESFDVHKLDETTDLHINIIDYHNLELFITTKNNIHEIYTGNPPELKSIISTIKIQSYSSITTYNNNYILIACLENSLLSKININTGYYTELLQYSTINNYITEPSKFPCSLSFSENFAYIGRSLLYDSSKFLQNEVIKIEILEGDDGPIINNDKIKNYLFDYKFNLTINNEITRHLICENLKENSNDDNSKLLCQFLTVDNTTIGYEYKLNAVILNDTFNGFEDNKYLIIYNSEQIFDFNLRKINSICLRTMFFGISDELTIEKNTNEKYIINVAGEEKRNLYLASFTSINNCYFYNNNHIFSAANFDSTQYYIFIKKNVSYNFIRILFYTTIDKIIGYYDNINDKYLIIFKSQNSVMYLTLEKLAYFFITKTNSIEIKLQSNEAKTLYIKSLFENENEVLNLDLSSVIYYPTTLRTNTSYNLYNFNQTTQSLEIYPTNNNWVTYNFYFYEVQTFYEQNYYLYFIFSSSSFFIRTCAFKCGSCYIDYNLCDDTICKEEFSHKINDDDDNDCFPIIQNLPGYIYNKETNIFEKCYPNCDFCLLNDNQSSQKNQNCISCKEGYFRSYEYMGNCFLLNNNYTYENYTKIISNINDDYFTVVNNCYETSKKYKINITGECVSKCPNENIYNSVIYDSSIDFNNQNELTRIGLKYTLIPEKIPKYLFGDVCLSTCPNYTITNNKTNKCDCIGTWVQNNITNKITCNNKTYCIDPIYNLLLNDTLQCVSEICPKNYYEYNNICWLGECPYKNLSFHNIKERKCLNKCKIEDMLSSTCGVNIEISDNITEAVQVIEEKILNGSFIIDQNIIIVKNNKLYYLILDNKNYINFPNTSNFELGSCENKLYDYYKIDSNSSLKILKIDVKTDSKTSVQYNLYNSKNNEKLNLSTCENDTTTVYSPITFKNETIEKYETMKGFGFDIFNPNDSFYNDICIQFTTENKTDILISDRKKDYYNSSLELCEENCEYKEYDAKNEKLGCECKIKTSVIKDESEIKFQINKLKDSFFDFDSFTNFLIIKCYKIVFSIKGIKNNIGSQIILSISIVYLIIEVIFTIGGIKRIKKLLVLALKIKKTIQQTSSPIKRRTVICLPDKSLPKISIQSQIKLTPTHMPFESNSISKFKLTPLRKGRNIKNIGPHSLKGQSLNSHDKSSKIKIDEDNMENKITDLIDQNYRINNGLNDRELNYLSYDEAIKIDKRNYCQYYWSLLKTKHLILFTFFNNTDYNIFITKFSIFLFSFCLYYTVTACFYTDDTMHKIYELKGAYGIIYRIPKIIYSTIISSIIKWIVKFFSLTEKSIIKLKKKNIDQAIEEAKRLIISFKIKYIIFYIISFIFLFCFWYYLSVFCAVYYNTQNILIKDTLSSFALSLLYPFGLNLIPGIFRLPALGSKKKNKEGWYNFSKFISYF